MEWKMNQYVKGVLIIFGSALVAGTGVAVTSHDPWVIVIAVLANIGSTILALIVQSPIPREPWTPEERQAKVATPPAVNVKGPVS
jgi:hypothetical protein